MGQPNTIIVSNMPAAPDVQSGDLLMIQRGTTPGEYMKMTLAQVIAAVSGGAAQVFIQDDEPVVAAGVCFAWLKTNAGDGTDLELIFGRGL